MHDALHQWYLLASSKNIDPGGPEMMAKASDIAACLGKPDCKGMAGWKNGRGVIILGE